MGGPNYTQFSNRVHAGGAYVWTKVDHANRTYDRTSIGNADGNRDRDIDSASVEGRDEPGSVEYQCIMVVFTLSSLSAQVRAIYVNRIKGSCPK